MKKRLFIIIMWITFALVLKINDISLLDIKEYAEINPTYAMAMFVLLWVLRLVILTPGVTLMVLGGVHFDPWIAFFLSTLGIMLSETIVYIIARFFTATKISDSITKKHPNLVPLIEKYDYKFLALGVVCPIAPTDVLCFLSSSLGMNYIKYLLVIVIFNIPAMLAYSFIGLSFTKSIYSLLLVIITVVLISLIAINFWRKITLQLHTDL